MNRSLLSLSLLFLTISLPAQAIVTRNCPEQIKVEFSEPQIEEDYAIEAYEELFSKILKLEEEFELVETRNSNCTYEPLRGRSDVYKVVLKGTLRRGSNNPATMVTYMILPIQGKNGEDIGDAIVYSRLSKITPRGIKLKNQASMIFYQSANCNDGPCVSSHIYVGTYNQALAK